MAADPQRTLLIQFARAPVVGRVKTRMIPPLSAAQACQVHSDMVLWTCRELVNSALGPVRLAVAGEPDYPLFEQCRELGLSCLAQQAGEDLGENMYQAIRAGLVDHPAVLLVGSDCPFIDRSYLEAAIAALVRVPVVLGPATDGGYVLIGARRVRPELFTGIRWGTEEVLAQTLERLRAVGWDWEELEPLADIDRPEDLALWQGLARS